MDGADSASALVTAVTTSTIAIGSTDGGSTVFETETSFSTYTPSTTSVFTTSAAAITISSTSETIQAPTTIPPSVLTSVVTQTVSNGNTPIIITVTSTEPPTVVVPTPGPVSSSTTSSASAASSTAAALSVSNASTSTSGLSAGGKIAVAVVVPVVAVALLVLAGLFFWRRRRQRKDEEELRRKEVEEYGFNPNNDPTLPAVIGGSGSPGDEPSEMRETDGAGYRGWGATPNNRKASTTLSGGTAAIGMARSDSGSQPSPYQPGSPTTATAHSDDPLVGRPLSGDSETIGALGVAPAAMGNRQERGINRGPSNASSAYSGANRSENSGEGPPHALTTPQYYNEGMTYDEAVPQHGPFGDGSYGGGQPIIRDVQARRNTRIENPSIFPQSGIAQNF